MYTANSRETTKKVHKKYKWYAKNERKWNHTKCSVKTTKAEKVWKSKIREKNKGNKQIIVTNMVPIKPNISKITLNVNDLTLPIESWRLSKSIKNKTQNKT